MLRAVACAPTPTEGGTRKSAVSSALGGWNRSCSPPRSMFPVLGSLVDLLHALLMAGWVAGLPLLFFRKYPRATRGYAIYAVVFIVLNQASRLVLGECFLTTISRWLWEHGRAPPGSAPGEWFTVRLAMAIFHMAPSHRSITVLSEALILVSAVGMLLSMRATAQAARPKLHGRSISPPSVGSSASTPWRS